MNKFRVAVNVKKINGNTNSILIDNVVNSNQDLSRIVGDDGKDFILTHADGEKVIPVGDYTEMNFLHIDAKWAETDNTNAENPIVENQPASFEFQLFADTPWVSANQIDLQGNLNLDQLKVRSSHSGHKIKIRYIIGASA
jgi:hypothetical protein